MNDQKGITMVGLLLSAVGIVLIGILLMRVVPVYVQDYQVAGSMKALNGLDATLFGMDAASNEMVLRNRLVNQLDVNGIANIKQEQITITPINERSYQVHLHYNVVTPLAFNASLLFNFTHEQEVTVGPH